MAPLPASDQQTHRSETWRHHPDPGHRTAGFFTIWKFLGNRRARVGSASRLLMEMIPAGATLKRLQATVQESQKNVFFLCADPPNVARSAFSATQCAPTLLLRVRSPLGAGWKCVSIRRPERWNGRRVVFSGIRKSRHIRPLSWNAVVASPTQLFSSRTDSAGSS
jgi:hypothetical protein